MQMAFAFGTVITKARINKDKETIPKRQFSQALSAVI